MFARPTWQDDAVSAYLTKNAGSTLPPASRFNTSGRAYPDVTAMSTGYVVYQAGEWLVSGSFVHPILRSRDTIFVSLPVCRRMVRLKVRVSRKVGSTGGSIVPCDLYWCAGNVTVQDGTSASTPVFAGIVARLNAARFAVGKSALGFLNPWLYSLKGKGFTDITEGNNGCYDARACCSEDLLPKQRGFHAVNGWDPASGWGSPVWEELLAAALA